MSTEKSLSLKGISKFWAPLAFTWVLMSLEGPFLTALVARMADPKENLAAYGVAFICGLILEGPVIMLMSAATVLVKSRISYLALLRFTHLLNFVVTALSVLFVIPPVFEVVTREVIGLPPQVSEKMWLASVFLIPWPAAIGIRRFLQGVLIADGRTREVAYGTVVRLVAMAATGVLCFHFGSWGGAAMGGFSLSVGVCAEALVVWAMARRSVERVCARSPEGDSLSMVEIWRYYLPLILTTAIGLLLQPIVTFFAGRGLMVLESLAVLPLINSTAFFFRAIGLSFQEVVLALHHNSAERLEQLRRFAVFLGGFNTLIFLVLSLTPLSVFWFSDVAGLSDELLHFIRFPFALLFLLPALSVWLSWSRGLAMIEHRTVRITWAFLVEMVCVIATMAAFVTFQWANGAVAGSVALSLGRVLSIVVMTVGRKPIPAKEL